MSFLQILVPFAAMINTSLAADSVRRVRRLSSTPDPKAEMSMSMSMEFAAVPAMGGCNSVDDLYCDDNLPKMEETIPLVSRCFHNTALSS